MEINWRDLRDFLILFVGTFLFTFLYIKKVFSYWKRQNVPHQRPTLPMGNFEPPWAIKKGFHKVIVDHYTEFKSKGYKHFGIFLSLQPYYVPIDLEILKHIMVTDAQYFCDRGMYYNEKDDPISANLINLEGKHWKFLRNKVNPAFTPSKIKFMHQLILNCGTELKKEIDKHWKMHQSVDIKELSEIYTTNVVSSCAFGLDCNSFDDSHDEFRVITKKFFSGNILRLLLTNSFPKFCRIMGVRGAPRYIGDFFINLVRGIVDTREANKVRRNDFLDILLEIRQAAKSEEDTFTVEEIAAQSFVFFLSFETTASSMTFALYELAKHQDIQQKVREEIRDVLAKYEGNLTYDAVMDMTYLAQVIDEAQRKYPTVPTLARVCTQDYKVPGEDLILKKGTKILIPVKGIHYDPEHYSEPEKFDPGRFSKENKAKLHACAYIPFGVGPRICIGMRFGILQVKIGIAVLLRDYKFTISPKTPELKFRAEALVLVPVDDIFFDIEKV